MEDCRKENLTDVHIKKNRQLLLAAYINYRQGINQCLQVI